MKGKTIFSLQKVAVIFLVIVIGAYSARFRPAIPGEAGHPFRLIAATDSGGSRPPIPEHSGHPHFKI